MTTATQSPGIAPAGAPVAPTADGSPRTRLVIGYLNSRYPCLSHTFIEREIRAVRALGVDIRTFSIRPAGPQDAIGEANAQAMRETQVVLEGWWSLLVAQAWAIFTRPARWLSGLFMAQRLGLPGVRSRLVCAGHFIEAAKLALLMRRANLRHMHVHMANSGSNVALLACVLDPSLSFSLSIHGSLEFVNVDAFHLREKVRAAAFTRCITNFCRAQVMAWSDTRDWPRMHVVHTGLDVRQFQPRTPRASGPLRMMTVGRFDPIKGYPILLRACELLTQRGVDWSLEMVGGGENFEEIRQLVHRQGLSSRVTLAGVISQDEIQRHYEQADVFVLSSFMEGLPVVLMEAMAKELAVVATNIAGIPELVEHGVNGLLVEASNAEAMADALTLLAGDRELVRRLGLAGRRKVERDFSIDDVGRSMLDLFERYVSARG